jgi:hypothetical protein
MVSADLWRFAQHDKNVRAWRILEAAADPLSVPVSHALAVGDSGWRFDKVRDQSSVNHQTVLSKALEKLFICINPY